MKKNSITFKNAPKLTGRSSVGYPYQNVDIRCNKKYFGYIDAPNWKTVDKKYSIWIKVIKQDINEDGNINCKWKWINFKRRFETSEEAKQWIKEQYENIASKYEIYFSDESDD